jgi:hypothetical protein
MMGNIVGDRCPANILMGSSANSDAVGGRAGRKTALEPAPGNVLSVQQVADVRAGEGSRGP